MCGHALATLSGPSFLVVIALLVIDGKEERYDVVTKDTQDGIRISSGRGSIYVCAFVTCGAGGYWGGLHSTRCSVALLCAR